uniref:Uncharacterized protein n=1 Tax=Rhizophora mucronata TaxID=61149 RepID=A0A2P2L041_RHIMU
MHVRKYIPRSKATTQNDFNN